MFDAPSDTSAAQLRHTLDSAIRDIGYPSMDTLPTGPYILPQSTYEDIMKYSSDVLSLITERFLRSGSTPLSRLTNLGIVTEAYPLITHGASEDVELGSMARMDVVLDNHGQPKILEINAGSAFAGTVETHCRAQAWRQFFRDNATLANRLIAHDPLTAQARYLADAARRHGTPNRAPAIAVVGALQESILPTDSTRYFDLIVDSLRAQGVEAELFEYTRLQRLIDDPRYEVVFLHITPMDLVEQGLSMEPARILQRQGRVLIAPESSRVLGNKMMLAKLSTMQPDTMSAQQRHLVHDFIPWTRIVQNGSTWRGNEEFQLIPWAKRNRHHLVLKKGHGGAGRAVILGPGVSGEVWSTALDAAVAEGGWVVQDFVEPAPLSMELISRTADRPYTSSVSAVLSPFIFGGAAGGMYIRFSSKKSRGEMVSVNARHSADNVVLPTL